MRTNFCTSYLPRFSCNLCNLKRSSNIAPFDKIGYFRGAKKVTQVTWIFWYIVYPFKQMTTRQSLLVAWLDSLWIWVLKKSNLKHPLPYPERNQFANIKTKQRGEK